MASKRRSAIADRLSRSANRDDAPVRELLDDGPTLHPVQDIPVDQIQPNRHQPRKAFDDEALQALASTIEKRGLLQPILVRMIGPTAYELVHGERRLRASRIAGHARIRAIIRTGDSDQDLAEDALIENLHRRDLNPIELTVHLHMLQAMTSATHNELGERYGLDPTTVTRTLALSRLPDVIQSEAPAHGWRLRNLYELTQLELEAEQLLELWNRIKERRPSLAEIARIRDGLQKTEKPPLTPDQLTRRTTSGLRRAIDRFEAIEVDAIEPEERASLVEQLQVLLNRLEG